MKNVKTSSDFAIAEYKKNTSILNFDMVDVRPIPVLVKTINHLMQNILPCEDRPYWEVFSFIRDRARAISQELNVQVQRFFFFCMSVCCVMTGGEFCVVVVVPRDQCTGGVQCCDGVSWVLLCVVS